MFKTKFRKFMFNIFTCRLLASSSKKCRLVLKKDCHHTLLGFVDEWVFFF